jgi:hypothetical protein
VKLAPDSVEGKALGGPLQVSRVGLGPEEVKQYWLRSQVGCQLNGGGKPAVNEYGGEAGYCWAFEDVRAQDDARGQEQVGVEVIARRLTAEGEDRLVNGLVGWVRDVVGRSPEDRAIGDP